MAKLQHPDPEISVRVRSLIEGSSMAEAARRLDLAEATVARLAAGLRVTPGTALLAKAKLDKLAEAA